MSIRAHVNELQDGFAAANYDARANREDRSLNRTEDSYPSDLTLRSVTTIRRLIRPSGAGYERIAK